MNLKVRITDLSILMTVASSSLYVVFRNLGREAGSFAFLWAPITLILILLAPRNNFTKAPMKLLLWYGIIIVGVLQFTLWRHMTDWNQLRIFLEFYFLVVMMAILNYYIGRREYDKLAWLSRYAFYFIIISIIATNIALYFEPELVYQSGDTANFTNSQQNIYKLTGAMGYSYAQALICLIPILVYHIKRKKQMVFSPRVLTVILVLLIITEIRAQVFANILATLLITMLSLMGFKNYRKSFLIILFIGIIITSIPDSFYKDSLRYLATFFQPGTEIYYKINDLALFIDYSDFNNITGVGARAARYPMLIDALIDNPIFGHSSVYKNYDIMPGAHIFWMNRLALWGIPGFAFFIFMLYKIYKRVSSLFEREYRFYYTLSVFALIFLGLTKALGGSEPWLMLIVVIPGLYYLPHLQQISINKLIKRDSIIVKPDTIV